MSTLWRRCRACREVRPLDEFAEDQTDRVGRSWLCPPCTPAPKTPRGWHRRGEVAEDVEDLLGWGESPERAAQRMGMTAAAIARAMYRALRPDLARPFQSLVMRERRALSRADNHPWTPQRAESQRRRRNAHSLARRTGATDPTGTTRGRG